MSTWTAFRDQVEQNLGISTPEQVANQLGNVTAAQLQQGISGQNPDSHVTPAPSSAAAVKSEAFGMSATSIGGISVGMLAVIGIAVFLIMRRR